MDIDLQSLLVFRQLAACGSFTETGRFWNISQPKVSQMINRLEADTGIILFDRSGSKVVLTSDGRVFLERAEEACRRYTAFIDRMEHIGRRIDRKINIGMERSWYGESTLKACEKTQCPDDVTVVFSEVTDDGFDALESGRIDILLATKFLHTKMPVSIQEAIIRQEPGVTIAWKQGFNNLEKEMFHFPDILRSSVLVPCPNRNDPFLQAFMAWCQNAYGMLPAYIETFPDEVKAASAALAGLGVFIAPGNAIPRLGIDGQGLVHFKAFEFLLPEALTLGLYCRSDESDKAVLNTAAQLGRLCLKVFADDPASSSTSAKR